jgi:hypothetical protein
MAEPETFVLRLDANTTVLDLNDHLNYSLDEASPWQPALSLDEYQEIVQESIPINVLGAFEVGGQNYGTITLRNLDNLRDLLRQAFRAVDDASVTPVVLEYCPPNHGAKAIYRSVVLDWLNPQTSAGINSNSQLGANQTIEQMPIELVRRSPWQLTYENQNFLEASRWSSDPSWAETGAATLSYQSVTTPYGAEGAQVLTFAGAGASSLLASAAHGTISVTNGMALTVFVRVAATVGGTITALLRKSDDTVDVSSTATPQTIVAGETIDHPESQWFALPITASALSSNCRLRFDVTAAGAGTITLAEAMVLSGTLGVDDDRWHMAAVDLTSPDGVSSITVPTVTTITSEVISQTPTPIDIVISFNGTGAHADAFKSGVTVINSQPIDLYALNGYTATGFTSVLDNLLAYPSGNVLRYSPSTANTWQATADITLSNPARHIAVLAAVRNNSSTATFLAKFTGILAGGYSTHESRPTTIGPHGGTAAPQYIHLGEIHHYRPFQKIRLNCQGTATGQTLDLNRIIVVSLADDTAIISHIDLYDITMPDRLQLASNWNTASEPQYDIYTGAVVFVDIVPTIDSLRARTRGETVRFLIDGVSQQRWRYTADGTNAETYGFTVGRVPVVEFPR